MEKQENLTFDLNASMDRLYQFFSDLIEKAAEEKKRVRILNSKKNKMYSFNNFHELKKQ